MAPERKDHNSGAPRDGRSAAEPGIAEALNRLSRSRSVRFDELGTSLSVEATSNHEVALDIRRCGPDRAEIRAELADTKISIEIQLHKALTHQPLEDR